MDRESPIGAGPGFEDWGRDEPIADAGPTRGRETLIRHLDGRVRSPNPLALVAAVREAMRLKRADPDKLARFTDEAMAAVPDPGSVREVVCRWVARGEIEAGELPAA